MMDAARARRGSRAQGSLVGLFSDDDYPAAALRQGKQGSVGVRLSIGRTGRVTRCVVTLSAKSPALDAATCRVLTERARFTPATDARGRPTTDFYQQRVHWRLPFDLEPEPEPESVALAPSSVTASFLVRGGTIQKCMVQNDRAPQSLATNACAELASAAARAIALRPASLVEPYGSEIVDRVRMSAAPPDTLPGEVAALRQSAMLTIDGAGLIVGCDPLPATNVGLFAAAELCARARSIRFVALSGNPTDNERNAWFVQTVVLRNSFATLGNADYNESDPLALSLETGAIGAEQPSVRSREIAALFSSGDYPPTAAVTRQEGRVVMRATVDAAGKVTGCDIVTTSGVPELDAATCQLMRTRGQFTPTRDRQGRPVIDSFAQAINWKLPTAIRPYRARASRMTIAYTEERIGDCVFDAASANQNFPFCEMLKRDIASIAQRPDTPPRFKTIFSEGMLTGDTPPLLPPAPRRAFQNSATITIEPDGRVVACVDWIEPKSEGGSPPGLCNYYSTERYEPLPAGITANRMAVIYCRTEYSVSD